MNILRKIRMRLMLTCEDVNQFLIDYLEGELDEHLQQRFEKHIADCRCCHTFLQQYRETLALVREGKKDVEEPEVPEELARRTKAFLKAHMQQNHS